MIQAWAPSNPLTPGGYHQNKIIEGLANDTRKAREAGEDAGVAGSIVDLANGATESLGLNGYTGLDRAGNEISTRDAMLGSVGIKLRPIRFEQSAQYQKLEIKRKIDEKIASMRSSGRLNAEGRISDKQFETDRTDLQNDIDKLLEKRDKIDAASARMRKRGLMR